VENSSGNVSIKYKDVTYISASGYNILELKKDDIVPFKCAIRNIVYYNPIYPLPSVESTFVYKLTLLFPDVKYVIHFHDSEITYNDTYNCYKSNKYLPYGSSKIPVDIMKIYKKYGFFIIKEHGIFIPLRNMSNLDEILSKIYG